MLRRTRHSFAGLVTRCRGSLRRARFRRAEGGVALVEFALILPFLLAIYVGTLEIANVTAALRKVDLLSSTVGELIASVSAPTRTQVDEVFAASRIVLLPYDGTAAEMIVSAVGVLGDTADGALKVCSSAAAAGSIPRGVGEGSPLPVPSGLVATGLRMLLVEIKMKYKPLFGETLASVFGQRMDGIVLSRQMLWPVRAGRRFASQYPEIILPNGMPCPVQ
ncbi:TadE/TadG family type IV pilus assembly protein [Methylobacterium marchantiae]|uniref:TadE/TadG family type IV pilus assembly protein n=1 Tax=Methylobacterium marchantiae TaxID=600331 RepID=A0ABW3WX15_9HYPH|nr:hypothetical protein AIGOOFII_3378 [Methylobacterium marchantiae]